MRRRAELLQARQDPRQKGGFRCGWWRWEGCGEVGGVCLPQSWCEEDCSAEGEFVKLYARTHEPAVLEKGAEILYQILVYGWPLIWVERAHINAYKAIWQAYRHV